MHKVFKIVGIVIAVVVIIFLFAWQLDFSNGKTPVWGVTFSEYYARVLLKIDWRATYQAILDELPFQKLRLIAYWEYLEPERGKSDFSDLDWQIDQAQQKNKDVTLVVGYRVPRWPECHAPNWAKQLDKTDLQNALLGYLKPLIDHYKGYSAIKAWQVENEPFLSHFGECPSVDPTLLDKEIGLVKSIDPTRPVIVTDSGELSLWFTAARHADILGTTLYRTIWTPVIGYAKYFFPPAFYKLRAWAVEKLFGVKDVIVSELQAEPWAQNDATITNTPFDEQTQHFNLSDLAGNINFAQKTGLQEIYLWGPEWWYWRELHGDPSWMGFGKTLQ